MTPLEPTQLLLAGALYFLCFYSVARLGERSRYSARLLNHPLVYVLSLGIIVTTWSFYTAFVSSSMRGYGYNAYYIGYAIAFLFVPVLIQPVMRITRNWQLGSLADLFAFRFHSPLAGTLTTVALLLCVFPLIALQYMAVDASTRMLLPAYDHGLGGILFGILMIIFTLRFGTRDVTGRERNAAIVASLAFEAGFKLVVLLVAGGFAVYGVFGGFDALDAWLAEQPPAVTRLEAPFLEDTTNLLVLMFFSAAITMPHIFHMIFHENRIPQHLPTASWGVPLYLLLVSMPVLPILWSHEFLGDTSPVQFSGLMLGVLGGQPWLSTLFYTGGVAAGAGMCIVLAMSVSNMCMNHLLLRLTEPPSGSNLYSWLLRMRRILIITILVLGYLLHYFVNQVGERLIDTGFVAFIACLQFMPGVLTLLYWPHANSKGYISGLAVGSLLWTCMGLVPLLGGPLFTSLSLTPEGELNWNLIASISLLANLGTLLAVSLCTTTSPEERRAARRCSPDQIAQTPAGPATLKSPGDFVTSLAPLLGRDIAKREVTQALADLGLDFQEQRAQHMQQLRMQLETNLSALLGPTLAHQLIERVVPRLASEGGTSDLGLNLIESRLETLPGNLTGVALDLDTLRRHHRRVLQELPVGVCSMDREGLIILWNNAMRDITGLDAADIVGLTVSALPEPWDDLLGDFLMRDEADTVRHVTVIDGQQRWFNLHKSSVRKPGESAGTGEAETGQVILLEDLTETSLLEAELAHAERLSSIGRLAAGIAHEIGNPVTGIACLAQNLRDESDDGELREMAEQIIQQTRRISSIMGALVTFSHSGRQGGQRVRQETVDLRRLTDETLKLLALQSDGKDVRIINACSGSALVLADAQRIQQIMLNLLTNSRDASPSGSSIHVTDSSNEHTVTLTVTDSGTGIPKALQKRIFEPFFTTKDPGKGTGLGLSLVYSIVSDLGGTIRIESPIDTLSDTGTRVIVTLPRHQATSEIGM